MITPGTAPEGAYVPGTGFGQSYQGMTPEQARAQLTSPFTNSFGDIGQILSQTLNGILEAVVNGIVAGAQAVGMLVTGIIDTISGAIQWVTDGIASLFGVGAPPAMVVGSTMADAYDKQQELIGKVDDLMVDNAGFVNLCMSTTMNINWTQNNWMMMPFDTHVTEHKNADVAEIRRTFYNNINYIPNIRRGTLGASPSTSGGHGIVFNAPGVWVIDGYITTKTNVDAFKYFEVDVVVFQVSRNTTPGADYYDVVEEYTKSRFTYGAESKYITSGAVHKPVIIPDDGNTYAATLLVRYQTQNIWDVWGGAQWSSLSAVRQSIDTTDYEAEDTATNTIAITE